MLKKCPKCNIEKELDQFHKNKNTKDGFYCYCKECVKQFQFENKEKIKKRRQEYYQTILKPLREKNPEIYLLKSINDRCNNLNTPGYKYYGAKGIENDLTEEDIVFLMIRDNYDQIKRPSIERKNSKGHYTLDNCEFIDRGENTARRNIEHCSKPILQYDLQGNFIREFRSTQEVERKLGYNHSYISKCAREPKRTGYGFKWKYK